MKGIAKNLRKNAAPVAICSPTLQDIAWAAGIFEGEGCSHRPPRGSVVVTIGQKDPWLPNKLQQLFGGSVTKNINSGLNHGTMYLWRACGGRGRGFLYTIYTFLSPRRRGQIKKALGRS